MTLVTHSPSTTPTVAPEAPGLPPQLGERPQDTRVGPEARKAYKAAGFYPPMLTHVLGRRGHIATQVRHLGRGVRMRAANTLYESGNKNPSPKGRK